MKSTRKKAKDISEKNVVYVRYSEVEDLKQRLKDASRALSNLALSLSGTGLIALPPKETERLLRKSTDIKVTKANLQRLYKNSDLEGLEKTMAEISKNTVSHSNGYRPGMIAKSRRK